MLLSEFLESTRIFEPVEYAKTSKGSQICLGRVKEEALDVWVSMIAQLLITQQKKKVDHVSISKQYFVKDDSLVYLWKVVCKDLDWFVENIPRIDKTYRWQQEYKQKVGMEGEKWGESSLPGVLGKLEMGPQPEDYNLGGSSVFSSEDKK